MWVDPQRIDVIGWIKRFKGVIESIGLGWLGVRVNKGNNFYPIFFLSIWMHGSSSYGHRESWRKGRFQWQMMFLLSLNCQRSKQVEISRKLLEVHVWEYTFVSYHNTGDNESHGSEWGHTIIEHKGRIQTQMEPCEIPVSDT